jgi:hypothetical protein
MDALPSTVGLYVVVHVAVAPEPLSVHGLVPNVPVPVVENVTDPLGVIADPLTSVSVTVAVHVTDPLIPSDAGHESDVVVLRALTVSVVVPVLAAQPGDPETAGYAAVIVGVPEAVGVKVLVQCAEEELTVVSVQLAGLKVSPVESEKLTTPVGVVGLPAISVTRAVQVLETPASTVLGLHETAVVVVSPVVPMISENVPALVA